MRIGKQRKLREDVLLLDVTLTQLVIGCRQGRPLRMGQPGQSEQLAPPYIKICKKKCESLQYCDSSEFIVLTVGASRVLMSKAATNNICSNKHKA
jgi:hypothetical protein